MTCSKCGTLLRVGSVPFFVGGGMKQRKIVRGFLAEPGGQWQTAAVANRQLEFWPSNSEGTDREDDINHACREVAAEVSYAAYASLKRVQVVHTDSIQSRPSISTSDDAVRFFKDYWSQFPGNDQERFVIACLSTKNRIQSVVEISVGTLDASLVHPREVFKPAIIEGASSIILSHNHPSGDPTPSREDRAVTQRLEQAGELLGITVLDHIVSGDATGMAVSIKAC